MRIGLVSDTHDLLRPQVLDFLRGSDHIVHAGDSCGPQVLERLAALAPLTVVRGNNDRGDWAAGLPHAETVRFGDIAVHVGSAGPRRFKLPISAGELLVRGTGEGRRQRRHDKRAQNGP